MNLQLPIISLCLMTSLNLPAMAVPLVSVPISNKVIVSMDGEILPGEWDDAVKLSNFQIPGTRQKAREPSMVYLKADPKNLYLAFHFSEYALNNDSNQLKSFQNKLEGRQQPVWEDDSLEMRISPPWVQNQSFFYFGFNANMATYAIRPAEYPENWFEKIEIKTSIGNSRWSAELRVPWKALTRNGLAPESIKGDWRINFVRFEKRIPEMSTFTHLNKGEHSSYEHLGLMVFDEEQSPALQQHHLEPLKDPKSLPISLCGRIPWQGEGIVTLVTATETTSLKTTINHDGSQSTVRMNIPRCKATSGFLQYELISRSGKTLFRSAEYFVEGGSNPALRLDSTTISQMLFNGQRLPIPGDLTPNYGMNTLEIDLPPNSSVSLSGLGSIPWSGQLEITDQNNKWTPFQPNAKDSSQIVSNTTDQNMRVRKRFFCQGSKLTPNGLEEREIRLTSGGTYLLTWSTLETLGWDFNQPLQCLAMNLFVPPQVELLGAASREKYPDGLKDFNWPPEKNEYSVCPLGKVTIGDKEYEHFRIVRSSPLQYIKSFSGSLAHHQVRRENCQIFLKGKDNPTQTSSEIFYCCSAEGGLLAEIPRSLPVRILPALDGKVGNKFRFNLFLRCLEDISNPQLSDAVYETIRQAGINEVIFDTRFDIPPKFGLKFTAMLELEKAAWRSTYPRLYDFFAKYPEAMALNANGIQNNSISISYMLEHPETHAELEKAFDDLAQRIPSLGNLFWDFEQDPLTGRYTGDFSEISIARFAQRTNLKETLSPEIIRQKYSEQWQDFKAWELGLFSKQVLLPMLKKHGWDFTFYSDYDSPHAHKIYTLDWQYLAGVIDCAYMGYGRDMAMIQATKAKLGDTAQVYGLLTSPFAAQYESALILRRLVDARGGVLFWYEKGYGAKELQEISKITRLAVEFEDFLLNGIRNDSLFQVSSKVQDSVVIYRLENKFLMLLINDSSTEIKFELPMNHANHHLTELFSEETFSAAEKLLISIPAKGFRGFYGSL